MTNNPIILSPREPLVQGNVVTRSWWRFFNDLQAKAGSLMSPLVVAPNPVITPGDFSTGGTITLASSPPGSILGNSSNVAEPPVPQTVSGFSFTGGTLAPLPISPLSLSGNPTNEAAAPTSVSIGSGLVLNGNTLTATGGSGGSGSAIGLTAAWFGL